MTKLRVLSVGGIACMKACAVVNLASLGSSEFKTLKPKPQALDPKPPQHGPEP